MKKIYLMAFAALFGASAIAQIDVTFQVDMNDQVVGPNGVHVAGDFQSEAGFPGDWQPNTSTMLDNDADGIYEITVSLPAGAYQYKFVNGNNWGEGLDEGNIPGEYGITNNRFFAITDWHGSNPIDQDGQEILPNGFMLAPVKFGTGAPEGKVAIKLNIDMGEQVIDAAGVHVAGNVITPNWTPQYGTASPAIGNKYAYMTYVDANASYEYKFLHGDFWGTEEFQGGASPSPCTMNSNRILEVGTDNIETTAYCFNSCDLCAPQTPVTFRVNLTQQGGNPDGVSVAGSFQGWAPGATLLTDGDSDGIYETTVLVDQGTYEYKFLNGLSWGTDEEIPCLCATNNNRQVIVGEDPVTVEYCFAQCEVNDCADVSGASNITFRVNMNDQVVSPEGVYVFGNFTNPTFQDGAIQMTDDNSDGIYEASADVTGIVEMKYKYVNGDVNTPANEESANLDSLGCGCSNGQGGYNRTFFLSSQDEVLDAYYFNSCSTILSTTSIELGEVVIFPNPSTGVSYIDIQNPNSYTLRMNIMDITGKTIRENVLINSTRVEINTADLNSGLYFLNIVNQRSESATYKLMVQ